MQEWQPVSTSSKGRLAVQALEEFGANGYAGVNVVELSARAGVTTGSLYHHFGSKLGLYAFVRQEIERRTLDRMEGAADARGPDESAAVLKASLVVGFDYAVRAGFSRLLSERHPEAVEDPIEEFLARITDGGRTPLASLIVAAWRAALAAAADGDAAARRAREALNFLF